MDIQKTCFDPLAALFGRMDGEYARTAAAFGFACNGCEDNCCRTLFFHHTVCEYLYLRDGLGRLPPEHRRRITRRAHQAVLREERDRGGDAAAERILCPLNEEGRCILYDRRPMICRLHGVPHVLHRPDGRRQQGPGCRAFNERCGRPEEGCLDRTPLYTAMVGLERTVRLALGFDRRISMTIARMIVEDPGILKP